MAMLMNLSALVCLLAIIICTHSKDVLAAEVSKTRNKLSMEDRPKLIVSQDWDGQVISEGSSVNLRFVLFNAGSTEARDIKIALPANLAADSNVIVVDSLGPEMKVTRSIQITVKEPVRIPAKDAAARIEYHAKGAENEYTGWAVPAKEFVVVTATEYQARMGNKLFEWVLYFVVSFGIGVGYPASKVLLERATDSMLPEFGSDHAKTKHGKKQ